MPMLEPYTFLSRSSKLAMQLQNNNTSEKALLHHLENENQLLDDTFLIIKLSYCPLKLQKMLTRITKMASIFHFYCNENCC